MHAEYRRDVSHNYLIFHGEESVNTSSYQVRMLTGNVIPSVLKCRLQGLDGKTMYYYDITSKQSVASFYEQRKLRAEDLAMILKGFIRVMEEMAEFLMNADQLVLSPDYMFLDPEKEKVYFCCLPDYHHSVQEQFRQLTEYFLPKLEHEDPAAVNLGYGIYRKAMEPGLQLEHIKEAVYQNHVKKVFDADAEDRKYAGTQTEWSGSGTPEMAERNENEDRTDAPSEAGSDVADSLGIAPADRRTQKKEKPANKWKWLIFCAAGVLLLLGIIAMEYLGYLPEIPVEMVLGAAIAVIALCAVGMRASELKKKKADQSAEWRKKVQREIAGERKETGADSDVVKKWNDINNRNHQSDRDNSCDLPDSYPESEHTEKQNPYSVPKEEVYGETVVLSAGNRSGPASLISREPGELATIYLEKELTVIGKL